MSPLVQKIHLQEYYRLGEQGDPDLAVIGGVPETHETPDNPTSALLVVEVSDSTLSSDRRRTGSLYAATGILEYWIVNLEDQQLEVDRDPIPDSVSEFGFRSASVTTLKPGDSVSPLSISTASVVVPDPVTWEDCLMSEPRKVPSFESARRCYRDVAGALETAVRSPGDPLRLFTLASVAPDGSPEARTLVLRAFDSVDRVIEFHCDLRSPKVEQLRRDPRVSLLFYDYEARWQLRIQADAIVHHRDAECERAWKFTPTTSRGNYACPYASGDPVPDGFTWVPPTDVPTDAEEVYRNFVVVQCRFASIDIYVLKPDVHERGILRWYGDEAVLTRVAI
jgi:hypothetical protein